MMQSETSKTNRITLLSVNLAFAIQFPATVVLAQNSCDPFKPDLKMRRCIANFIIRTPSYLGNCTYSNAGQILRKAQDSCQLDCSLSSAKYDSDWTASQDCVDSNGPLGQN